MRELGARVLAMAGGICVGLGCGDDRGSGGSDAVTTATTTDATTDDGGDAAGPAALVAPADLGAGCAFGCNLETCLDLPSDTCEAACLWDGRPGFHDAYCTMACVDGRCPDGWTCIATADAEATTPEVCAATPKVCGDRVLQRGEACDDGNTAPGDTCAADCSRVTLPSTHGRVTLTYPGVDPIVIEGDVEGGFGKLLSNGALTWGQSNSLESLGFSLSGFAARTSTEGPQWVELDLDPYPCNFGGTTYATLTAFDAAAHRVAGHFDIIVACMFGCFDCGGDGAERAVSVDFDLVWLDRPDL